jgi:predicted Zn-dependent protease
MTDLFGMGSGNASSGYQGGYSGGGGSKLRTIIGAIVILFGIVTYFTHESVNPTTGEKQHVSMTADQEIAMGLQSAPEMEQQMGGEVPASDPRGAEVEKIGQFVVDHSIAHRSPYQYKYHLLNDPQTVNAFALPGGQVFITVALYTKLADEAELAGVLGHETGHVVERHSAQQIEKSRLGQTLVLGAGIAESDKNNGMAAIAAAGVANQMIQLKFSRDDESQADERGLEFMTEAGFDPQGMYDVMDILNHLPGSGSTPGFLQTHPHPADRMEAIKEWISEHPNQSTQYTRGDKLPQ